MVYQLVIASDTELGKRVDLPQTQLRKFPIIAKRRY
jgi:hypothetical protein